MLTVEDFDFSKLNRVPKEIIKEAIKIHRQTYPGQALNRNTLCSIVSMNLEKAYLPKKPDDLFFDYDLEDADEVSVEEDTISDIDDVEDSEDDLENSEGEKKTEDKKKKEYNGEHLLKKMGLDKTRAISRKIDFYIYKHYLPKK